MSLGIDPAEYRKFYFALILGVNLTEIFDPTSDQAEIFVKIFSVIFSIKSETDNVKYLIKVLVEALKDVKLSDKNIQKKFDKFVRYLSFIYSFIGVKLNIEYDAKVLAGEIAKKAEKQTGGLEGLKAKISQTKQMAMGIG